MITYLSAAAKNFELKELIKMKKKTHKEFVNEVFNLVGDEYEILGQYINTKTKIKMKHKKCGKEFNITPSHFLTGNRCPYEVKNQKKTQKEFTTDVFNLVGDKYEVLGDYINAKTKIKMRHNKCRNVFYITPNNFLQLKRCPFCIYNPTQVAVGFNSIYDTNKDLFKMLANPEDGYKYTKGSHTKVDWRCPKCGMVVKNIPINRVNKSGLSCPMCSDGISYPNRLMFSVLYMLNVDFEPEKSFKWSKRRYDFYFILDGKEYTIEMDGYFHFNDNQMNGQTKEISHRIDTEKDNLAKEHGIYPIRIDSQESELEYIKNNIMNSYLKNILIFSNIDWHECSCHALTSLKIQACELWKEYHNIKTILTIMKRGKTSIRRWLKLCASVGLCDYNPISKRKVIYIESNEIFDSIADASRKYNVSRISISKSCKGIKSKYSKNLHWQYID